MAKIAVFDSGLGSLSIIMEIQKIRKAEIIYFGDQENFPYGKKSKKQLERIIKKSIKILREKFSPDLVVIGSNTPTIVLDLKDGDVIGVRPPVLDAAKISRTRNIGILGTESAVQSRGMSRYIKSLNLGCDIKVYKINGSALVELVESGKFLTKKSLCKKAIHKTLEDKITKKNIDVITLSSTHLPFLRTMMEEQFPTVTFVDPAKTIAKEICKKTKQGKKNQLRIFASGDVGKFQCNLRKLGIRNMVRPLV